MINLQLFRDAMKAALAYKNESTDFMDEIMKELEVIIKKFTFLIRVRFSVFILSLLLKDLKLFVINI